MLVDRKKIFDAVKVLRNGQPFTLPEVHVLDAAIDAAVAQPIAPPPPKPATKQGTFTLGEASQRELAPAHPKLRLVIELAIQYSIVDFRVKGPRSVAEQKKAVASGNSRTMKSKHLPQPDGNIWAVDLIALKDGAVTWDMVHYAAIACAVDKAASELGLSDHIRWGCAWDRVLSDFGGDPAAYMAEAKAYAKRHAGSDLIDGPHFEWVP